MMNERKTTFLLVAIIIFASFLRLFLLSDFPPGLYADEAANGNNAVEALNAPRPEGGLKVFYPENNGREGLFINIQALSLSVFGSKPWALRLPSAIFGILTVLGVYFLTRELFKDEKIALLAAFLIATSFWHINFSRIGFRAIMAPAFLAWGLYLLLLSYRRPNWLFWGIVGGIVYGLGMHSYIAYRATPLLVILALVLSEFKYGLRPALKVGAAFITASIIVFLPLGFYFLENPADFFGRTSQISVWQSQTPLKDLGLNILKTAGQFNVAGDWNPRHNIPGRPLLFWPVGILFLIGLIVAVRQIKNFPSKMVLGWLAVAALPVVVSNEGMPHALRAIIMAPPVFILAAWGGIRLYEFIKTRLKIHYSVLKTAAWLFLILLIAEAAVSYFLVWAKKGEVADAFNKKYVEIGEQMNKLPKELPKYVVIDTGGHDVREIGTPAQTIMFITGTYLLEEQKEKNTHYIPPSEIKIIPENAFVVEI